MVSLKLKFVKIANRDLKLYKMDHWYFWFRMAPTMMIIWLVLHLCRIGRCQGIRVDWIASENCGLIQKSFSMNCSFTSR
jgi:hypothetical protein